MTGIYLRIERDGSWKNLDVAELTDEELGQAMAGRGAEELARWVVALGRAARKATADLDGAIAVDFGTHKAESSLSSRREGDIERVWFVACESTISDGWSGWCRVEGTLGLTRDEAIALAGKLAREAAGR